MQAPAALHFTPIMLPTTVVGDGPETAVFMSGFPDNHSVWLDSLVPAMRGSYRCVVCCLPEMDLPAPVQRSG